MFTLPSGKDLRKSSSEESDDMNALIEFVRARTVDQKQRFTSWSARSRMTHSRSNSQCPDGSSSHSVQAHSVQEEHNSTQITSKSPLTRQSIATLRNKRKIRNFNRRAKSVVPIYERKFQVKATSTEEERDSNNPLLDFIISRKSPLPRSIQKTDIENVWYEDDHNDLRKVFYTEDSKECTPFAINLEQECLLLREQLQGLERELQVQAESHDHINHALRQRNYALETACQNLERDLQIKLTIQEDLHSRLIEMQEEKHELLVQHDLLMSNMLKPTISTGMIMDEPSALNKPADSWEPSIQIVQEHDSVPKEEFIKIMREHAEELREKTMRINSLEIDLKNWIAENRKLVSARINLEEANQKLSTELNIRREQLMDKAHMINTTNSKLERAFLELTMLKEQKKEDDLEISRIRTHNNKLEKKMKVFQRKGSVMTLTQRRLEGLANLQDEVVMINNNDNLSLDSKTEGSDRSAKDDDSIKSNFGSLAERSDDIPEDDVNVLSHQSEYNLPYTLVEFGPRPSWGPKQDERSRSSVTTISHQDLEPLRLSSLLRSGSTVVREKIRSEVSSLGLGGPRNLHLSTPKDTDIQVKYSRKRREAALEPIFGLEFLWYWRWPISSSFIIMATFLYLMKSSNNDHRRNRIRRRRAVS